MGHARLVVLSILAGFGIGFLRGGWQEAPPLPQPRWFHAATALKGGGIAVLGGYVLAGPKRLREYGLGPYSLLIFDPSKSAWQASPEVPEYRYRVGYWHFHDDLQGGATRVPKEKPQTGPVPYEVPNAASDAEGRVHWFTRWGPLVYDTEARAWTQGKGPLLDQREDRIEGPRPQLFRTAAATTTGSDGRIYLIGGLGHPLEELDPKRQAQLLGSVEVYDPASDTWGSAAPLPTPRQLFAATTGADGRIYVFGGCECRGWVKVQPEDPKAVQLAARERLAQATSVGAVEAYDPATDTWETRAPMLTPRQMLAAARGADGLIYVIGGVPRYGSAESLATVEIYDPATDSWSEGPSLRTPRHGHAAVATRDGRVYAIGGVKARLGRSPWMFFSDDPYSHSEPLASVEVLDTGLRR